jgi:hypothetical protein
MGQKQYKIMKEMLRKPILKNIYATKKDMTNM